MSELPQPESRSEHYWRDMALSLRRIAAAVEKPQEAGQSTGDMKEAFDAWVAVAKKQKAEQISLPADLPGRDKLIAAGINTLDLVPRDGDALTAIDGIGTATAGRILSYLANL